MHKKWIELEPLSIPQEFQDGIGGSPVVAETLYRRGITDLESAMAFINADLYIPAPATDLPNLIKAVNLIETTIKRGETILVWGDFDVDGQTATTLFTEALHDLGGKVMFHIPVRATEGHGINPVMLDELLNPKPPNPTPFVRTMNQSKLPGLLLTCDTGISEHEAVEIARKKGIRVVITDHHELPVELPSADAVINPHFLPGNHPLGTLPGVGVAYKLVEELFKRAGKPDDAEKYMDLVALGIVADVTEIKGDTRYLLQRGLQKLRQTKRIGLKELYKNAGILPDNLDEGHIGYTIGPRLNALGRLSDAASIVEFLTTDNQQRAQIISLKLENLNENRKLLTTQIYQSAIAQLERDPGLEKHAALVLSHPGWPNGVVGIVASRLVDIYGKPAILLNENEDGSASGSARSVEGVHITEAIAEQSDLLLRFGGHAGAAGLSLPIENISTFRTHLSRTIRRLTTDKDLTPKITIDASLLLADLSLDLVDDLERLGPFGAANHPLTLMSRNLKLLSHVKVGQQEEHRRIVVEDLTGSIQEVMWWQGGGEILPEEGTRIDLAYQISSRTYQGIRRLQVVWQDFRLTDSAVIDETKAQVHLEITDYRSESNPYTVLNDVCSSKEIQVWVEGESQNIPNGRNRLQLVPGTELVIWSSPPNHQVLQQALDLVKPDHIYLFGKDPELDSPKKFIERLYSLLLHVIRKKEGKILIDELAAVISHTTNVIYLGLKWLEAKGEICWEEGEVIGKLSISFCPEGYVAKDDPIEVENQLKSRLDEIKAFRKYFARTDSSNLFGK